MNNQTKKNLDLELKKFFFEKAPELLTRASMGWIYTLSYEKEFLIHNFYLKETNQRKQKKKIGYFKEKGLKQNFDLFEKLQSFYSINEKWKFMKGINSKKNFGVLNDSFENKTDKITLQLAKKFLSSNNKLNVLVIGAGCCGLFFANNLKKKLGKLTNILVCDNRIQQPGVREPYSRNWLTNLPKFLFNNKVDKSITEVFDWFSNGNYIGVTLNMMEILLLQSCKKNDIKFLFKDDPYDDLIKESNVDLLVDATGGKISEFYPSHKEKNILLKIPTNQNNKEYLSFFLKEKNNYHYPFFLDKQIINYQFKIVGISENLSTMISKYINENNYDNLFYVWVGKLNKELNEVLIIVNIKEPDIEIFHDLLKKRICIKEFEFFDKKTKSRIDNRIVELIKIILNTKTNLDEIYLEPPFSYTPRIKLFYKNLPTYYDRTIIPIGDSYYTGNAKVGNGLGMHLLYIDELTKYIKKCFF